MIASPSMVPLAMMKSPVSSCPHQGRLVLLESHWAGWLNYSVSGTVLAKLKIWAKVVPLHDPDGIAPNTSQAGRTSVASEPQRIIGGHGHPALGRTYRVGAMYRNHIRRGHVAWSYAQQPGSGANSWAAITFFFHTPEEFHSGTLRHDAYFRHHTRFE